MKTMIVLALIAFAAAANIEYYILEDMDMDKLVDSIDDLSEFTKCLLEKIPCNKVYESYRANTLEAVQQFCRRCTPHVKHMFWQYLQAIRNKLPEEYVAFRHKYDPDNHYFDDLEIEMEKYKYIQL